MNNLKSIGLNLIKRSISTTVPLQGKKNFRKFLLYNKRGTRIFKQARITNPDPEMPIDKRGVRDTGYLSKGAYVEVAEKIPEIIVPDLKDCQLRPYVSYKAPKVIQSEYTSQDLFNAIYAQKIIDDFKNNLLTEEGNPVQPSKEESLSPKEAWNHARKTGSDIF